MVETTGYASTIPVPQQVGSSAPISGGIAQSIEQYNELLTSVSNLCEQLRGVGDMILGPEPEALREKDAKPGHSSLLGQLNYQNRELAEYIQKLDSNITRIRQALN